MRYFITPRVTPLYYHYSNEPSICDAFDYTHVPYISDTLHTLHIIRSLFKPQSIWEVKTDIIQCIHLCFSMLAISFYFVNCVIISCKLSFNSRFNRNQIPIMSFLGFIKAELSCKMSELHLYVVKRQNWVVIIRK